MSEITDVVGRDSDSKTYKWALALPVTSLRPRSWKAIAWFKTRKAAEGYAKRVHGHRPYAIARGFNL